MIKLKKLSFKNLQKLTVQDRLEAIKTPGIGQALMSALTPTQIAELFPRYYLMREPDISGFLKALPTGTTAAKQAAFQEQLENTASGDAADKNMEAGGWRRKLQEGVTAEQTATPLKPGEVPQPKLTPDQLETAKLLTSGQQISVDDPKVKFITSLTPKTLENLHLEKVKDESGKEFYKYAPPAITDEEVKKSMAMGKASGTGEWARDKEFMDEVNRVAAKFRINPNNLLAVMANESEIRADNVNRGSGATGLIQFMPETARNLGTSTQELKGMSRAEQMKWVEKYFDQPLNKPKPGASIGEIYAKVFLPARAGKEILAREGEVNPKTGRLLKYYESNRAAFDREGKGYITEQDITNAAIRKAKKNGVNLESTASDSIAVDLTPEQVVARRKEMELERSTKFIGDLASSRQPQMGTHKGETTTPIKSGSVPTDKWSEVTPMGGTGFCGRGVVDLAKKVFKGTEYFDKARVVGGLGGNASSVAYDNKFFQNSGMYQPGERVSVDKLTPEFIESLPPGTIVAAGGGRADGAGHIQMKVGNKWMSDHQQSRFYLPTESRPYKDYTILRLTPQGESFLAQKGYYTPTEAHSKVDITNVGQGSPPAPVSPEKEQHVDPMPSDTQVQKEGDIAKKRIEENVLQPSPDAPPGARPQPQGGRTLDEPAKTVADKRIQESVSQDAAQTNPDIKQGTKLPPPKGLNVPVPIRREEDAKPVEQKAPEPPKVVPQRYKFNEAAFVAEVRAKEFGAALVSDDYILNELRQGFKTTPGVSYKNGVLTVDDPKSPAIQQIVADMKKHNFDSNKFLTQIKEEKKKEEPKPEVKPVAEKPVAPPAPTPAPTPVPVPTAETKNAEPPTIKKFVKGEGYAGLKDVPNPNYVPPKKEPPKSEPPKTEPPKSEPAKVEPPKTEPPKSEPPKAQPVKTNAKGGENETNTSQISAMPIGGLKDDNSLVVDANQKPLFTMNTDKEAALYDPRERKVDVIPKGGDIGKKPTMGSDIEGLLSDIMNLRDAKQQPGPKDITRGSESHISDRDPDMIERIMDMSRNIFLDPTAARAFSRARFVETGDATNDFHHSGGNSNMKN